MSDRIVALIRTVVPGIVGAACTWGAKHLGLQLDSTGLTAAAVTAATGAYYLVVSSLERKWPAFGVLLGVPKTPSYGAQPPFETSARSSARPDLAQQLLERLVDVLTHEPLPEAPAAPAAPQRFLVTVGEDGTPTVVPAPEVTG